VSTCNPLDYLSLSTRRQGALAPAPRKRTPHPLPSEGAGVHLEGSSVTGSPAGQRGCNPPTYSKMRCFLLRSRHGLG
jgi:hypothetical protein